MEENDKKGREEIFSRAIRAGKRTYFFDVKATRKNDYYLTITESKKRYDQDGKFHFEKHKLFLYKEDFEKFTEGLNDVVDYIKENQPEIDEDQTNYDGNKKNDFTDVKFDDLKEEN
ncbi:MAG: PUR family DNA/RNA-binding protein [Bacteroidales bacterium]|nr:PUR family DNA/RNA-binding protein [Bacteroidales bacterium]